MEDRDHAPARSSGPEFRRVLLRSGSDAVVVPLDRVDEILMPQPLTRVPGAGPEVCGLLGLRGRVLTVFDLGVLLGGPPVEAGGDHRILVVRAAGRVVGLAVTEASTIGGGEESGGTAGRELDLDRLIHSRLA
jgi:purine-binding chemotaxis protein CheW